MAKNRTFLRQYLRYHRKELAGEKSRKPIGEDICDVYSMEERLRTNVDDLHGNTTYPFIGFLGCSTWGDAAGKRSYKTTQKKWRARTPCTWNS